MLGASPIDSIISGEKAARVKMHRIKADDHVARRPPDHKTIQDTCHPRQDPTPANTTSVIGTPHQSRRHTPPSVAKTSTTIENGIHVKEQSHQVTNVRVRF
ncbi:hypothetical protein LY78DRAFT_664478 [Colletotrichum sublineola]|nr:hypothetical protein LY78DRAFT_664478 [Colletotrichum sublineola]